MGWLDEITKNLGSAWRQAGNSGRAGGRTHNGAPVDLQVGPGSTSMRADNGPQGSSVFNPYGTNSGTGSFQTSSGGYGYKPGGTGSIVDALNNLGGGTTGGGRGGGGGGYGGASSVIDTAAIRRLLDGYTPKADTWESLSLDRLDMPEYNAPEFYEFDGSVYDQASQGLRQGIAADRRTGNDAYAGALAELDRYQNPFGDTGTRNAPMDATMQRWLQANGVQADQAQLNQGAQADVAFGRVMDLLGGVAEQSRAAEGRALSGDQRRFNESLDNQGRNMQLGIDMALANARSQYERDAWRYGVEVAQQMYQARVQEAIANNQTANQEAIANNQGVNQTNANNNAAQNAYDQQKLQTLIDLLASGQKVAGV